MKNLIILFLMLLIFISCDMSILQDDIWDFDCPKVETLKEAQDWISNNIKYRKDNIEKYQTPQETIDRRYGDCDDQSILLIGILYNNFKNKGNIIWVETKDTQKWHIIIRYKGNLMEYNHSHPTRNYNIIKEMQFNDIKYYCSIYRY